MKAYFVFEWDSEYCCWVCDVMPEFEVLAGDLLFDTWDEFVTWRKENYENCKDYRTCYMRAVVG